MFFFVVILFQNLPGQDDVQQTCAMRQDRIDFERMGCFEKWIHICIMLEMARASHSVSPQTKKGRYQLYVRRRTCVRYICWHSIMHYGSHWQMLAYQIPSASLYHLVIISSCYVEFKNHESVTLCPPSSLQKILIPQSMSSPRSSASHWPQSCKFLQFQYPDSTSL
jgi:hypothetical protein